MLFYYNCRLIVSHIVYTKSAIPFFEKYYPLKLYFFFLGPGHIKPRPGKENDTKPVTGKVASAEVTPEDEKSIWRTEEANEDVACGTAVDNDPRATPQYTTCYGQVFTDLLSRHSSRSWKKQCCRLNEFIFLILIVIKTIL